jgi:uncharacterized membrane protein
VEISKMMDYGAGPGFGFGGLLALLGCALLVVGFVVLVAWAVGRLGQHAPVAGVAGPQSPGQTAADAVEVLRLRFARGEMSAEEYAAAKQVLEAGR